MASFFFYLFFAFWSAFVILAFLNSIFPGRRKTIALPGLVLLSFTFLFFSLKYYSKEKYPLWVKSYSLSTSRKELVIGNRKDGSDITIFNPNSVSHHLRIGFGKDTFFIENLSNKRRVEFDGEGLDILSLKENVSVEVKGAKIKVFKTFSSFPLSKKIKVSIDGKVIEKNLLLHSPFSFSSGPNKFSMFYSLPKFLIFDLYIIEIILLLLFLSLLIYFFLKGEIPYYFFLIYLLALPGFLGLYPFWISILISIFPLFRKLNPGKMTLSLLLVFSFVSPLLREGDFKLKGYGKNGRISFRKEYAYGKHLLILGFTPYSISVKKGKIKLEPLSVEGIKSDVKNIYSGNDFLISKGNLYLPFPREFSAIKSIGNEIKINGKRGGSLILSSSTPEFLKKGFKFCSLTALSFIIVLGLLWIFSSPPPSEITIISVLFFMLFLSLLFSLSLSLFNPNFYFSFSSYARYGLLPGLLLVIFSFSGGIFRFIKSSRDFLIKGLNLKQKFRFTLMELRETGEGISLFEILNRKISGQILWVDLLFFLSLLIISLQYFFGAETGIKTSGFSFQLFEAGKILLAVYLADWLFRAEENKFFFPFWLPYILVFIPFLFLIFTMSDFSPLAVFSPLLLVHFVLLKIDVKKKIRAFLVFFVASILSIFLSIHFLFPKSVALRILSWVYPGKFPDYSEQFLRAFWLFKQGGSLGNFPDSFSLAGFVPLLQFDFPLSLFSASFGLLGLILLFLTLLIPSLILLIKGGELLNSSYEMRWNFYALFFIGIIFLSQCSIPLLILTGLLPVMGQPFPFLSKANSNLLLFAIPYFLLNIYLMRKR